jgi:hypothetical protein
MNQIQKIESLINQTIITLSSEKIVDYIDIEENQENAKLTKLTIENLPKDALVFTLDARVFNIRNQFLSEECQIKGVNKGCDAILICELEGKINVLFCELKSFDFSAKDYELQFENSFLFLEYLCKMIEVFEGEKIDFVPRYFLFCLKAAPRGKKTATRYKEEIRIEYKAFEKILYQKKNLHKISFVVQNKNKKYSKNISLQDLIKIKDETL